MASPDSDAPLLSAPTSGPREFSLAEEAANARQTNLQQNAILGAVIVAFGLVAVGFLLAPPTGASPKLGWLVAGIFGGMDAVVAVMVVAFWPGAPITALVIGTDGLTFRRGNSAEEAYRWADPEFGLTLLDYSDGTPGSRPPYVGVRLPHRRQGVINLVVVVALTETAGRIGLPVLVREELVPNGRSMAQVRAIRIGVPEKTPGWRSATLAPD